MAKLLIVAVKDMREMTHEEWAQKIAKIREKYANLLETDDVTLKIINP